MNKMERKKVSGMSYIFRKTINDTRFVLVLFLNPIKYPLCIFLLLTSFFPTLLDCIIAILLLLLNTHCIS